MNKQAKQLRTLRNDRIYNGDVPLEKGCEIKAKSKWLIDELTAFEWGDEKGNIDNRSMLVLEWEEERPLADSGDYTEEKLVVQFFGYMGYEYFDLLERHSDACEEDFEILGKPVDGFELLLMLGGLIESGEIAVDIVGGDLSIYNNKNHRIDIDLTKSPEEQEPETIQKLIDLIK